MIVENSGYVKRSKQPPYIALKSMCTFQNKTETVGSWLLTASKGSCTTKDNTHTFYHQPSAQQPNDKNCICVFSPPAPPTSSLILDDLSGLLSGTCWSITSHQFMDVVWSEQMSLYTLTHFYMFVKFTLKRSMCEALQ